jgi:cob(I)alamin adenosyltransferase
MKIYTKTGDRGETSLFTGKRVMKAHGWVHLYGCLDELNCSIGVLRSKLVEKKEFSLAVEELLFIQRKLFSLGSFYASEATKPEHVGGLKDWVERLEKSMDMMSEELPPLKNFILPGGSLEASLSHQVRVKARSVEREAVATGLESVLATLVYLNRLSDYFFVLARYINFKLEFEDVIWVSEV